MERSNRPEAAPVAATTQALALTAGTFLVAGGMPGVVLTFLGLATSSPRATAYVLLGWGAVAGGAGVLRWGRRLPRWGFHVMDVAATLVITAAVMVSPWPDLAIATTALYAFIAIDAFYMFTMRHAVAQLVGVLAAALVAVSSLETSSPAVLATALVVPAAIGLVVSRLVRRASSASRDSLTGLLNRRGFDEALSSLVEACTRAGRPLAVALLDVDHFKVVNDTHGHDAGDELLCELAEAWSAVLPAEAVLGRRGGDEFALAVPGVSGAQAAAVVEEVRASAARVGTSAGLAQLMPGCSPADLLRRADVALYEAKSAGRGRTAVAPDGGDLVPDLAAAIANDEVLVVLQPVVDLADGSVVGAEALARWTHAERGPVSPAEFVAAAEAAGLMVDLGAAVLRRACREAAALSRDVLAAGGQLKAPGLLLTVNVSGRQLVAPGFVTEVLTVLAETGWPARQLVVEVTESLLEASSHQALDALAELRELGVAVAIDDFGTGYSTLSRLDELPADYLKLDHSFIHAITSSPRRTHVLRAFLELSAGLGIRVIAEGVEHPDQAELLRSLGCPLAQGYHFSRPQPPSALLPLLLRVPAVEPA